MKRRLAYQPALDGLRALAVTLVLFHHDGLARTGGRLEPGGFLGVDMFFVLSGFLITSILLSDHAKTGRTISGEFWLRRARRLLPALVIALLLVTLYAAVFATTAELSSIRNQGISTLLYVENWWVISGHAGLLSPLSQAWSLSIEEQWYLVWPFLLAGLLLLVRGRRRALIACILAIAAASYAVMALTYSLANYSRVYNGTDTRAWELLAGAAVAVVLVGRTQLPGRAARWTAELAGLAGVVVILWVATVAESQDSWLYHWGMLVVVLATIAIIVAAIQDGSPVLRPVMGWRPFVALGLISYGVYLYHLIVFSVLTQARVGIGGWPLTVIRFSATFALAAASYLLVEKPIRHGVRWSPPKLGVAAVVVGAVVVALVVATVPPPPASPAQEAGPLRLLARTAPPGATRTLIAGDGEAFLMSTRIAQPIDVAGLRGASASMLGCGITDGQPLIGDVRSPPFVCPFAWAALYREAVKAFDPQVVVLILGQGEVFDRYTQGKELRIGTPAMRRYLEGQLEQARRILTRGGAKLLLATVPCVDPAYGTVAALAPIERDRGRTAWVNTVWRSFARQHADTVQLLDLGALLCPAGDAHAVVGGVDLRPDGTNLSAAGVQYVWSWLAPIARAAARPPTQAAGP